MWAVVIVAGGDALVNAQYLSAKPIGVSVACEALVFHLAIDQPGRAASRHDLMLPVGPGVAITGFRYKESLP